MRKLPWLTDAVAEWLEPLWRAGWSSEMLSREVEQRTGLLLTAPTVRHTCAEQFGERDGPVIFSLAKETRLRKCCVCRKEKTLPRFIYTCELCRKHTDIAGMSDDYRMAGVRVR